MMKTWRQNNMLDIQRMKPLTRLKLDTLITMSMPSSQQISIRILPLNGEKEQLERANKIIEKGLFISYEDAWEEAKNWGYKIDDEENLMSTYNPDSKWDWYCEGGRWGAWLLLKEKGEDGEPLNAISATKEEVDWDAMLEKDRIPFCFVTEDGDWHESASMGWWAMTTNDKDEDVWRKEFLDYLESVEDDVEISVIDFHI